MVDISSIQPGDFIIARLPVKYVGQSFLSVPSIVNIDDVISAEERPIEVGETVWYHQGAHPPGMLPSCPEAGITLLYIHQGPNDNRKWAVGAYKGDIPMSLYYDQLRRTR